MARAAGDDQRERQGQFWRFVALMELGRVTEAESALAAYAREAAAAGDAEAAVTVTARHAMLAALRGRLDEATRLTREVAEASRKAGMADADAITGTLGGLVLVERGTVAEAEAAVTFLLGAAVRQPGHLFEATAARIMAEIGRTAEAAAELDRLLPRALAASGPRWVGALADLALVAARTGQRRRRHPAGPGAGPVPGQARGVGRGQQHLGTGLALSRVARRHGRPDRGRDPALRGSHRARRSDRRAALPRAQPRRARRRADLAGRPRRRRAGGAGPPPGPRLAGTLGLTHLLERLVPPPDEWTLTRDGDDWVLEAGAERARLRDGRGLHYLRALLAAPGRDIAALDLAAGGAGLAAAGTGPVLDDAARDAYRRRLGALAAGLDAADRAGDGAAAAKLEAERQALVGELSRAAGLAGRHRLASPEAERARVNVTRTLRAVIERIAPAAPSAAAHLRASVKTGASCRYEPAPGGPSRWHV